MIDVLHSLLIFWKICLLLLIIYYLYIIIIVYTSFHLTAIFSHPHCHSINQYNASPSPLTASQPLPALRASPAYFSTAGYTTLIF